MACLNVSSLKKAMRSQANTAAASNAKPCDVSESLLPVVKNTGKYTILNDVYGTRLLHSRRAGFLYIFRHQIDRACLCGRLPCQRLIMTNV